jgi:hypothetical protein
VGQEESKSAVDNIPVSTHFEDLLKTDFGLVDPEKQELFFKDVKVLWVKEGKLPSTNLSTQMKRLLSGGPPAPLDSYNTELPPEIHQVVNEIHYE